MAALDRSRSARSPAAPLPGCCASGSRARRAMGTMPSATSSRSRLPGHALRRPTPGTCAALGPPVPHPARPVRASSRVPQAARHREHEAFTATRMPRRTRAVAVARELNEAPPTGPRGRRRAEAVDDRPRTVAGSLGPPTAPGSLSPDVNDPAARNVSFEELAEPTGFCRGADHRRRDLLRVETIFDTQRQGAIFAVEEAFDTSVSAAGRDLGTIVDAWGVRCPGRRWRRLGQHPARHPLLVGSTERWARSSCGCTSRSSTGTRTCPSPPTQRGLPNESGAMTRRRTRRQPPRRVAARGLVTWRGPCGCTPSTPRRRGGVAGSRRGWCGGGAVTRCRSSRSPSRSPRGVREHRRGERTSPVAQVRPPHGGRPRRGGRGGRDRAGPGCERGRDPGREHGRGDARRRRGDDPLPAAARFGAGHRGRPDHGRQLALVGHRGRASAAPGQGRRQLDLAQEGEDEFLRQARCAGGTARRWS